MKTDIQALNIPLTDHLRQYLKRRIDFALSTREDGIQHVMVRLSDVNGPKGGRDMCCHIQVAIAKLPDVVIKDIEEDIYTAIDRAAARAGRAVARQLARKTGRARHSAPREIKRDYFDEQDMEELSA